MAVRRPSAKANSKVTAKETSGTLAKEFPDRETIIVTNKSTKEVWLALGGTAVKEEGIPLAKENGIFVLEGYTGPISCITTSGEGSVTYSEF